MSNKQSSIESFFTEKKTKGKSNTKSKPKQTSDPSSEQPATDNASSSDVPSPLDKARKSTDSSKETQESPEKLPASKKSPVLPRKVEEEVNEEDEEDEEDGEDEEEEIITYDGAPVDVCPQNTPPCCLLQTVYDGKSGKAFLFLLDEHSNKLYGWYDTTGHKPYCLSDLPEKSLKQITPVKRFKKIVGYESIKLRNLLIDKEVTMTKISVTDPLAIGGGYNSLRDKLPSAWEANIRYHYNYLYDTEFIPGMYYQVKNGELVVVPQNLDSTVENQVRSIFEEAHEEVKALIPTYLPLFLARVPYIKRAAIDIEVYTESMTHIADPRKALKKVISVSIVGNDGLRKVFVLERDDVELGERPKEMPADVEIIFIKNEADLLRETFKAMHDYPIVITFNGDNFDLPYLYFRAKRLGLKGEEIPITVRRDHCTLNNSLHFDAYRFFNQAAVRVYAFGNKYSESSLNAIGQALLDKPKVDLDDEIGFLSCYTLAWYNYYDSMITLELTTFNDSITITLIILLMRLSRMPFEDITRQAVSGWVRNWLFAEHRHRDYLIPLPDEIIGSKGQSTTNALIKGKKYKGGFVIEPDKGVHFNVTVLDFASLYPSIIKTWNLSYETMNCPHESCQENKKTVPDTDHWVCTKNKGLMSALIGFIRDMRVSWFKPKAKDSSLDQQTRSFYNVIQAALKVVINASYGVFGAVHFPFYCPPLAEATTAIGRAAIRQTIEKCESMGVKVIYGDTDSVFLKEPTKEHIKELIAWSDEHLKIDLDVEKSYRYLALSQRKKNYLGVYPDGKVDVKGLLGKKRNTPPFLKKLFTDIVSTLSNVKTEADFEPARKEIESLVKSSYSNLKKRKLPVEELVFRVQLNKALDKYVKTTPQHVKAARLLKEKTGQELGVGDLVSFIKTSGAGGVKPLELATVEEVDVDKYVSQMESTLSQILEPIGVSFDRIIGIRSLDDFFS